MITVALRKGRIAEETLEIFSRLLSERCEYENLNLILM